MKIIGIVGGSGAGKSLFCSLLEKEGIPTLNTDITAREVVKKGSPCLGKLCDYFGKDILLESGELDRKALARIAFSDEEKHKKLNTITHFYITREVEKWLSERKKDGNFAVCIDAPLLFESGLDKICFETVALTAHEEDRIKRICARDGIGTEDAKLRIDSQKSDKELKALCTRVIENTGSLAELAEKAKELAKIYREERF